MPPHSLRRTDRASTTNRTGDSIREVLLGKSWVKMEGDRVGHLDAFLNRLAIRVLRECRCTGCGVSWAHAQPACWVWLAKPMAWRCITCLPPLSDPESAAEREFFGGMAEW